LDDVKLNVYFMKRKLQKVSSAHFTTMCAAENRWSISSCIGTDEAMSLIRNEWFDLIILDHHLEGTLSGLDVSVFAREHGMNKDAILVLNTCSEMRGGVPPKPFNLFWSKPLPSVEKMRRDLIQELLISKSIVNDIEKQV